MVFSISLIRIIPREVPNKGEWIERKRKLKKKIQNDTEKRLNYRKLLWGGLNKKNKKNSEIRIKKERLSSVVYLGITCEEIMNMFGFLLGCVQNISHWQPCNMKGIPTMGTVLHLLSRVKKKFRCTKWSQSLNIKIWSRGIQITCWSSEKYS